MIDEKAEIMVDVKDLNVIFDKKQIIYDVRVLVD